MSEPKNIAIFGATGHIGKNLSFYFSQNKKNNLYLFGRNQVRLKKTIKRIITTENCHFVNYDAFHRSAYDLIINCVGVGDPASISKDSRILEMTEHYDNKIIDYLKKNRSTTYINISSGVVYGHDFRLPASESTSATINVNHPDAGYFYSVAKIYAETKHRLLSHLKIVDLRIFSFFSRFIDLNTKFLMSEIVAAIKLDREFVTDKTNIVRDYIHPEDLYYMIRKCAEKDKINMAFDICSKKPVNKLNLLKSISKEFGLQYSIREKIVISPTGIKPNYYSKSKRAIEFGFTPKYSSLETIMIELKFLLNSNV